MQPTLATPRLKLVPAVADDAGLIGSLLAMRDVDSSEVWRRPIQAVVEDHLDPASMTALWRLATEDDARAGLIGLATPSVAAGRLRAIGWRSLEMVVAIDPRHRRQGLASEAVDALVAHAVSDGVTFAVLAAVAAGNAAGHALMRRCRFEQLGRVAGSIQSVVVYERAG
jgi:RimJ/RimL family protein N-acetyltransferase